MKTCPGCGVTNPGEVGFCGRCGRSLSAVTDDAEVAPSQTLRFAVSPEMHPAPGVPSPAPPPSRLVPSACQTLPPASFPLPGQRLAAGVIVDGKYAILSVVGEGGMGIVYLARDIHTEMPVVVKSIRSEYVDTPEYRTRILAEGRALARIDHPNVVHLNAVVVEPNALYLVMQYIEGEPLDVMIRRHVSAGRPIAVSDALRIFRMIVQGVDAAHEQGVIHRDLKPANILIRARDGMVKVTDFGIAKWEEEAKAGRGITVGVIGSPLYMAPEQVIGQRDLDKRIDVYALGILLYELLIGRTPFYGSSDYEVMKMHAEMPVPSAVRLRPELPRAVDAVIRTACAKNRDDRYGNCGDLLRALESIGLVGMTERHAPLPTGLEHVRSTIPSVHLPAVEVEALRPAPPQRPAMPTVGQDENANSSVGWPAPAVAVRTTRPARWAWACVGVLLAGAGGWYAWIVSSAHHPSSAAARSTPGTRGSSGHESLTSASGSPRPAATASQTSTAQTTPQPIHPDSLRPSPLKPLVGRWKGEREPKRDYEAVLVGDALEFRVVVPAQFAGQGYVKNEARFVLSVHPDAVTDFAVEDRLRPMAPKGFSLDPRALDTCRTVWREIDHRPLMAHYDEHSRALTIDLVQIRTTVDQHFRMQGNRITACVDLDSAQTELISSRLVQLPN